MVELGTRKREKTRVGTNHYGKLGLERSSYASQVTITDTEGTSPDPACNYTNMRSSQPDQACRSPDFSYLLVFSISFSSSSPSLFFSSPTLLSSQNRKWNHSSQSLHAMIMSWYRVQHTSSTASTQDCLSSIHSQDYKLTTECSFSFRRTSLYDQLPSASAAWELKGTHTLSHSHSCKLTNWWIEFQHPVRRPSTASKYWSNLTRS